MNTNTATAIKKQVGENLYLADVDGVAWATNRYWLAPARKLAPLLDKFNIDEHSSGAYDVNGTVKKRNDDAPDMGRLLDVNDYRELLTPLTVAGKQAHHDCGDGQYAALFTREDHDEPIGIMASWLTWLSEVSAPYGVSYGAVQLFATTGAAPRVALIAREQIEHGGHNGEDGRWVPRTYTDGERKILAVVMSRKVA